MRKALRWLLSLVLLVGAVGGGVTASTATADEPDIKDRILAIPGMSLIQEKPVSGYRYFVLNYTQPVDHRHRSSGTGPGSETQDLAPEQMTAPHNIGDSAVIFHSGPIPNMDWPHEHSSP